MLSNVDKHNLQQESEALRKEGFIMESGKYYAAYEERYKVAHALGVSWASRRGTPVVSEVLRRYGIQARQGILEIGCGEGRDARVVLEQGFSLTATDISGEAIAYCKETMPAYRDHFSVLDCLSDSLSERFDFIYAVAVIHMLVLDEDRDGFYRFIHTHLKPEGIALICTMGDGEFEMQSDIRQAFELQERTHASGKMMVAGTSCRMVSFPTFHAELTRNDLKIVEQGITSSPPEFDSLMFAVVKRT